MQDCMRVRGNRENEKRVRTRLPRVGAISGDVFVIEMPCAALHNITGIVLVCIVLYSLYSYSYSYALLAYRTRNKCTENVRL